MNNNTTTDSVNRHLGAYFKFKRTQSVTIAKKISITVNYIYVGPNQSCK